MKIFTTLSAAALAAFSFAAPVKAADYSTCVPRFGNTSCAALILSSVTCAYATNPQIAHWSAERKTNEAFKFVNQKWNEAGVNFARIDGNVMTRLAKEYNKDFCQDVADKIFPSRNLY